MRPPLPPAGLSADRLLVLGAALLAKRDQILRRSSRALVHDHALDEVRDDGDVASFKEGARVRAQLGESDWALLREVERAVVKLRNGTYGVCEATGEPIGYERLAARPWSVYSVEAQQARECPPRRRAPRATRPPADDASGRARMARAALASSPSECRRSQADGTDE